MALAEYYERAAWAGAQVLGGFDIHAFSEKLSDTSPGVAFDPREIAGIEGETLLEVLVRLLARLYPKLLFITPPGNSGPVARLRRLARSINPRIDVKQATGGRIGIVVGRTPNPFDTPIYAGSRGWDALISHARCQPVGGSPNPLGAAASGCLAAANLFRAIFLADAGRSLDSELSFSTLSLERGTSAKSIPNDGWNLSEDAVLVGVGAIGNAAAWVLARSPIRGVLHLVDDEAIELSNLQRYILARRADESLSKVRIARRFFRGTLKARIHTEPWQSFVASNGYNWDRVLVAVDSAKDRRAVAASLPRWVANAWTQPGDLGVSVHPSFGKGGACLACLYLPEQLVKNQDQIVAEALAVPHRTADVRTLLHLGGPTPDALLDEIGQALGKSPKDLSVFRGRPIRDLYVEGVCGGALIPINGAGQPSQDMHVPLAHQSALAGILLAATLIRSCLRMDPTETTVTRINVLRPMGEQLTQLARRRADGRCLCDDSDFITAYSLKYP